MVEQPDSQFEVQHQEGIQAQEAQSLEALTAEAPKHVIGADGELIQPRSREELEALAEEVASTPPSLFAIVRNTATSLRNWIDQRGGNALTLLLLILLMISPLIACRLLSIFLDWAQLVQISAH